MATATKKAPAILPPTRVEAEAAMRNYGTAAAQLEAVEAQKKLEQIALDEKYSAKITELNEQAEAAKKIVQGYAEAFPEIFNDKKSTKLGGATIGYRSGTAKLEPREGWDWEKVEEWLDDDYKRSTVTIDKKALLAAVKDNEEWAIEVGVQVVQEESFYIKLKD